MSENFESGLRDLYTRAAQAHDAGTGLPMTQMVGRARRRRALFDTGVTLAAAAVVGVLVLGAAAAGGLIDRDPVPPVETPDETVDPVAWDVDYAPCGQTLEALGWQVDPAGSPMGTQVSVDSQALLTALAYLGTGQIDPDTIHRADSRADILAVDASSVVVVGVLGISPDAPPEDLEPPTEEILSLVTTAPLFSCRQQDGATRLEPGVYDLAIARDLQVLVDNALADRRVIAVTPLTVPEPPAYDPEALPAALLDGPVPWCDEAFDVATTGDPQLSVALGQRLDDASGEVAVTITMTNDLGAGPVQMPVGFLRLVLTRDGIAVGFGDVGGDSGGTIDPGTTRVLDHVYVSAECPGSEADPDTGLPPGVYQLWAVVPLGEDELHVGGAVDEPPMLVAGPWPFMVTDEASPDGQSPETMPLLPPEDHYQESSSVSAIPLSEDSLEDGDYFGYLSGIDAAAGTVQVDIAIFYTGQAAIDYLTANDPTAENPPPGGFWIANDVERIRSLTLSPDVRIWDWCYGNDLGFAERTLPEWAAAPATGEHSCDAGATLSHGWGDGTYWFDVRDGVVMQVIGQYLP